MDLLSPIIESVQAAPIRRGALAQSSGVDQLKPSELRKIRESAMGFETALLRQMLREVRSASIDPMQATTSGGYLSLVDDHMADLMTKSGGLGFGRAMADQLIGQLKARELIDSKQMSVNASNEAP